MAPRGTNEGHEKEQVWGKVGISGNLERAQIGGSLVPPFCPFDEFDGEDESDGEGDGGEPVDDAPVGVPAELSVV